MAKISREAAAPDGDRGKAGGRVRARHGDGGHTVRGARFLLHGPDRRAQHGSLDPGAEEPAGFGHPGPGAAALRDGEGQRLCAGGDKRGQVSRCGQVRCDYRDAAQGDVERPSYTKVFANSLIKEADQDDRIVAITAAMPDGTGLDLFEKAHPERAFDVGIAEQHGVTFCAGLAAEGFKPFAAIYSTFLQRAYDQVVHDVAIQKLPVRFAIDRAGLVGADGQTHAGAFDVTYLSCLPGMVVMAAGDEAELVHMVSTAVAYDEGPMAFRYPRGEGIGVEMPEAGEVLTIGKGRVLREGSKLALLSFGGRLAETLKAADELAAHGYPATVADARFAKPLDTDLVERLVKEHEVVITIEEASIGGFATQVLEYLAKNDLIQDGLKIRPMHLPDRFQDQASPFEMYDDAELNASHIVQTALLALGAEKTAADIKASA